ncbi:hypothetical protein F2P56_029605 [Juglans regia]|uniref:Uncharacterized protein n=1 Tax=Juglans regia TaxID=51240 RepID=A0A833TZB5_JUGRE|nr:hypothetical protein F2P56_029605 [Juglans regia]
MEFCMSFFFYSFLYYFIFLVNVHYWSVIRRNIILLRGNIAWKRKFMSVSSSLLLNPTFFGPFTDLYIVRVRVHSLINNLVLLHKCRAMDLHRQKGNCMQGLLDRLPGLIRAV